MRSSDLDVGSSVSPTNLQNVYIPVPTRPRTSTGYLSYIKPSNIDLLEQMDSSSRRVDAIIVPHSRLAARKRTAAVNTLEFVRFEGTDKLGPYDELDELNAVVVYANTRNQLFYSCNRCRRRKPSQDLRKTQEHIAKHNPTLESEKPT